MSEKYTPRVGDKVRATLGESVMVGLVKGVDSDAVMVLAEGVHRLRPNMLHPVDGWQFEHVQEIPTKWGAVIRRWDGREYSLAHPADTEYAWVRRDTGKWAKWGDATAGGFSVLFDGVDE